MATTDGFSKTTLARSQVRKSYGNTVLEPGAQAHLGDIVNQNVNLHIHIGAPQQYDAISAAGTGIRLLHPCNEVLKLCKSLIDGNGPILHDHIATLKKYVENMHIASSHYGLPSGARIDTTFVSSKEKVCYIETFSGIQLILPGFVQDP